MGQYCFLLRRIIHIINHRSKKTELKSKEATTVKKHKQFYEIECEQELFNDLGNYENVRLDSLEKSKLEDFSLELSSSSSSSSSSSTKSSTITTTDLSSLPMECLTQIFKNKKKNFLNSKLLKYGFKIPNNKNSLFNYSIYLKELSYVDLYQSVDSGIKYYRKSFIGRNTYKLTYLITKSLYKYFIQIDDIFPNIELFTKFYPGLYHLDITLPYFENNQIIIDLLISIIKSQKNLQEFNLSGARIGANFIIPILFSFHYNSLISIKFQNINFHKVNLRSIISCKKLKNLTIYHCTGLTKSSLPLLVKDFNSSHYNGGMRLKSLNIGCNDDIITTESSSSSSSSSTSNSLLYNLFHALLLERLTVIISPKNSDYEELNIHARDLPSSCWYLELQCGYSVRKLCELLLSDECVAPIRVLIINYLRLDISHLMIVRDFAMVKGTLKYFGIGGRNDFDKDELDVIKELQYKYNVTVNYNDVGDIMY
ncbi:unnamed protein product [Rhizophagus irregularis]|nr:unnamed protein product [Rhizophagus irregularis]